MIKLRTGWLLMDTVKWKRMVNGEKCCGSIKPNAVMTEVVSYTLLGLH